MGQFVCDSFHLLETVIRGFTVDSLVSLAGDHREDEALVHMVGVYVHVIFADIVIRPRVGDIIRVGFTCPLVVNRLVYVLTLQNRPDLPLWELFADRLRRYLARCQPACCNSP